MMANLVFDFLHNYETGERRESEPANAYQYDEGHVLEAVLPEAVTSCEIHYWIRGQEKSEAYTPGSIVQNDDGSCTVTGNIPNTYFETNGELRVYIVVTDGDASITTYEGFVHICQRSMPDDYVDDDPENEATRVLIEAQTAAATATAAAETCEEVLESIPEDYSQLSDDVDTLKDGLEDLEETVSQLGGLSDDVKQALLQIASKVAYIDEDGQDYYDALEDALYAVTGISIDARSITLTEIGGTRQLTATTTPVGGAVTWVSSDTSVATISSTGLVTSVGYGSCTITASSGSVSASCAVTVAQVTVTSITATYQQSGTVYDTDTLDVLKGDLTVTANYSDGSTAVVSGYTLSGTLEEGTSVVTVSYEGETATFNVTVTYNSDPSARWTDGVAYDPTIINDEYYAAQSGEIKTYSGWNRTDYMPCKGAAVIEVSALPQVSENHANSNCFFDDNYAVVEAGVEMSKSLPTTIRVPNNAAYLGMSSESAALATCVSGGITPYAPKSKSNMDGWASGIAYEDLNVIQDSYVRVDGTMMAYVGWDRTDYVPCNGVASITFPPLLNCSDPKYCVFYNKNKTMAENFTLSATESKTISVSSNVYWFVISAERESIASCINAGIVPNT